MITSDQVATLLRERVPAMAVGSAVPLGAGTDNVAFLVNSDLVVRFRRDAPDPASAVRREAALLDLVASVSPVPVPAVQFALPELGCLAYQHLAGTALLDRPATTRAAAAEPVSRVLGGLLAALHTITPALVDDLVETDRTSPAAWLSEARADLARVRHVIAPAHRPVVDASLAEPPPRPARRLRFSHNDLGIEHVLVGRDATTVTGVLDWTDAAMADPAHDFGLILRDLGPTGLAAALSAYAAPPGTVARLRDRARFYARCALLADLAYGLEHGDARYADKSLATLPTVFGSAG